MYKHAYEIKYMTLQSAKSKKISEHNVKKFQGNKIVLLWKMYIQWKHFEMCLFQLQNYILHDSWHCFIKDLILHVIETILIQLSSFEGQNVEDP